MIERIDLFLGKSHDPHYNLAVEQHLLETVEQGQCVLYLWQNQNTVVIGRNQNPWIECRTTLLQQEGGTLARRLSGGGAVFHDLGNLNFTFLVSREDYDLDRQLSVIQEAVGSLGIPTERSGRNDILAQGRKFSGNAFYKNGARAYHHGTLLVEADMEKMGRYLSPSKAKLEAKKVDSVRSRVVNLRELNPAITVQTLHSALARAFSRVYGLPLGTIRELDEAAVDAIYRRNRSWEWNFGQKLPFTFRCEGRFPWGGLELSLDVRSGIIMQAKAFTDAMDWTLAPRLEQALNGLRFTQADMEKRILQTEIQEKADIIQLLSQQNI